MQFAMHVYTLYTSVEKFGVGKFFFMFERSSSLTYFSVVIYFKM